MLFRSRRTRPPHRAAANPSVAGTARRTRRRQTRNRRSRAASSALRRVRVVGQPKNIICADLVIFSKLENEPSRRLPLASFIARINIPMHMQQICHLLLRLLMIFAQVFDSWKFQYYHPAKCYQMVAFSQGAEPQMGSRIYKKCTV